MWAIPGAEFVFLGCELLGTTMKTVFPPRTGPFSLMRPRGFALFSGCTLLFAYFAAFHAPAELSGWLRCFHSKFGRESLSILMTLPIVAARCRCSLAKIRRARTHCKLLRRLPYVPRPPVRFRILRRAVGGLADVADGAARSKDSKQSVCSCLLRKCRAAGPYDNVRS